MLIQQVAIAQSKWMIASNVEKWSPFASFDQSFENLFVFSMLRERSSQQRRFEKAAIPKSLDSFEQPGESQQRTLYHLS